MKRKMSIAVSFILAITCVSAVWAQDDAGLKAEIDALYTKLDELVEAKDVETYMTHLTDDYHMIFAGPTKETVKGMLEKLFESSGELRSGHTLLKVTQSGDTIKVLSDQSLEGKSGDEDWAEITKQTEINFLVREEGALKFSRSIIIDKGRLDNVQGRNYKEKNVGFSFTVPENWDAFPTIHPRMLGTVYVQASDGTSAAMFGYLELPGYSAKQAAEGDEAAGKKLSKEEFYKRIKSGPITVDGHEGYEIESKFFIPQDRERHRRRIYFNAGGLLYVLCFDAMPPKQWDAMKDGFQSILDSFKLDEQAQKDGAKAVREMEARGEIVDRIYSNGELGCQIAAPEGWKMTEAPLGPQFIFNVNITPPNDSKSIVRFLAVDLSKAKAVYGGDEFSLEKIIKDEIKGLEKLTENVEAGPIEDIQVGGHQGKTYVCKFSLGNIERKRKNAYFVNGDTLFCLLCDADPISEFESLIPKFDEIINSMTLN